MATCARSVREIEHLWIPLSDGTRLAARIWLPDDAEDDPVPALLEYLPYRKRDGTAERDALTHPWLAGCGYASVRVDVRGTGESEGTLSDEYTRQEHDDALDVIAWLAAQPWCTGAVGMFGISWGGFNALQVAARQPPALKAIVTVCSTDDRYRDEVHYMGGAKLNAGFGWAGYLFAEMCRPPDPALVGAAWRGMWLERLHNLPLFLERWLDHQHRDAYWRHGSVCEDYAAIRCPVFAVGGWVDGYTNAVLRLLENLTVPRKGLIGPWAHGYPHITRPGPQIGFLQEMIRWWDHWLKGKPTGIMNEPMLRAWMTGSVAPASRYETLPGRWVAEPCWPPCDLPLMRLHLTDGGLHERQAALTPRPMRSSLTVGEHGGEWCPFGSGHDQADDQQEDDARSLCWDSAPLDSALEILGAPILTVRVAADKPIATVVARLCDVLPSGESRRMSFGILNLTHRDCDDHPSPLDPGEHYTVRIKLKSAGGTFAAGHRLRLALSTAYWPMVWPAPEKATVTVFSGALELPVRGARPECPPALAPAETAPPAPLSTVAPNVVRFDSIGLVVGSDASFSYDVREDDPLSATASMSRTDTVMRATWQVRIETTLRLSATLDSFLLHASMRAFESDREICQRQWNCVVARRLL